MKPFTTLSAVAAPLPMANIDTDKIIPSRFMKTIQKSGLGTNLFDGLRYQDGVERPDFVLNQAPYRNAEILITHENFGCGSSREHAPWALIDFGIRCIIAPGFADIFYGNCFKNGILPIVLAKTLCDLLMADAHLGGNARLSIDLERQEIVRPDGDIVAFDIDPALKTILLEGLDDITRTLTLGSHIDRYEDKQAHSERPLYPDLASVTLEWQN